MSNAWLPGRAVQLVRWAQHFEPCADRGCVVTVHLRPGGYAVDLAHRRGCDVCQGDALPDVHTLSAEWLAEHDTAEVMAQLIRWLEGLHDAGRAGVVADPPRELVALVDALPAA